MKSKSLSLLTGALTVFTVQVSPADVLTLQPVDDAYLSSSGGEADQTFNSTELAQFGYYGAYKRPLLKFDLSSIPEGATVTSAQLTLQQTGIYGGEGYFTTLSRMTNDNWFETNVTWNTYNQTGAVVIATLPSASGGTKTWQINLAQWAYVEDLADDAVTFMVRWDVDIYGGTEGDGVYKSRILSSKEGSATPTLRIEYTAASASPPRLSISQASELIIISWPSPATGWLLERTDVLNGGPWLQVSPPYQTNGDTISATFTRSPAVPSQFFRLHKP